MRVGVVVPMSPPTAGEMPSWAEVRAFAPGEQLTIVLGFAKGVVSEPRPHLVDRGAFGDTEERDFLAESDWMYVVAAILAVAGVAFVAVNWWRNGRDRVYTSIYYLSNNPEEETRPFFHRDPVVVEYTPGERCLEWKSLKFYLWSYRDEGAFCEGLAARIADDIVYAIRPRSLRVTVHQNIRGGIALVAEARRGDD